MRHLLILLIAGCVLTIYPVPGRSQGSVYTFKGKSFNLPTPTGFCVPDPANRGEADFVKVMTTLFANAQNTVVKLAVECGELKRRHADPSSKISDYMAYYYPDSTEKESLQGSRESLRKAVCDDMRKQGDATISDVPDIVAKAAQQLHAKMAVNSTRMLGVLAEDAHGCYAGVLVNATVGASSSIRNVDILATIVHDRVLFVSLYSEYKNPSESKKFLLLEEAIAADLDSKNPD